MDERVRYYHWKLADIPEFAAMLAQAGSNNLVMRFWPHRDGPQLELVDAETGEVCGTYNFTMTCPPICM